ncbi:MAG: glycosyltransferase family 2 protein [Bacteroidales bacterium]
MKLKVAVVILNWNGEKFLRQFLPSVVAYSQGDGIGVFVADNGSTDNSLALLDREFKGVYQIKLDKNYGFAEGYNRALQQIDSEYFVLLNSDVEVAEGWLTPLVNFMDSHPNAAACAPKIMDYSRKEYFEYAGAAGGFIDRFGYPFCRGRILSEIEMDNGQYNDEQPIFWASGACMFVRASVYLKLGGLDDRFFAHMEEIDLCWRFQNHGYSLWNVPASKIYHVGGGTLPNNNPHKLYLNYRNSLYMLHKNLHSTELFTVIFFRLILDGLSAFAYLLTFKFPYFKAVFQAHVHYYRSIGILNRFRANSKCIKMRQIPQIYSKSILLHFFLFKRRKYSLLNFK